VELIRKYIALTKPGIIRGNVMTAGAGFLFGARGTVDGPLLLAVLGGTTLVIACGCVLNNYLDRHLDARMARTKQRAMVTRQISVSAALVYAVLLGVAGFGILIAFTHWLVVLLGVIAVVFYVVVYGYVKRRSPLGTLVGTVPGAASLVAGYVAVRGSMDGGAFILFLIMVCWQMPHFYAIAIRRKDEYAAAGIPVLPIKRGIRHTKTQILLYIAAYVVAVAALSIFGYAGKTYLVVMLIVSVLWLRLAAKGLKNTGKDTVWAGKLFGFSLIVLMVFSLMISLDHWLP